MGVLLLLALFLAAPAGAQLLSPGELSVDHAELEGLSNCTQCHTFGEKVPDGKCLDCHTALAERLDAGKGYHATFAQPCVECHSDHRGRDFPLVRWEPEEFDHQLAGYALEGAHAEIECQACHTTRSYLGLEQDCLSCHTDEHRGQLGTDCLSCHTFADWAPASFDHQETEFPLHGRHTAVECGQCHPQGALGGIPFAQCSDCHADRHDGQFTDDCASCHTVEDFVPSFFDHERSRFKLRGRHVDVECASCHADGLYRPLAFNSCSDCHADPHRPTLGSDCSRCHTVEDWTAAAETFDHRTTRFPLEGSHTQVECEQCHAESRFAGTPFGQCSDCHADRHDGQFTDDCAACHTVDEFAPSFFDHERSRFKLRGRHVDVACVDCHADGLYRPLAIECASCHTDYHRGQFAEDCAACHTEENWTAWTFDHDRAAFGLDGAHAEAACHDCHRLEQVADAAPLRRFKPLAMECQDCHR